MPRRRLLTEAERDSLLAIPADEVELIRLTTFSDQDISLINQHRGEANRLGFATQLCYLRYPGNVLEEDAKPAPLLLPTATIFWPYRPFQPCESLQWRAICTSRLCVKRNAFQHNLLKMSR